MKEFYSTTGGRHLYNVDFKDMLELALSCAELFRECGGNFVISGCQYDSANEKINAGYVWLNGKIRKVSETSVSSLTSLYIIVSDSDGDAINYADGASHKRCSVFGAEVSNVSSDNGIAFDVDLGRFPNLSDVFMNHYALVKNAESQTVNAETRFNNKAYFGNQGVEVQNGTAKTLAYVDSNGSLCLKVQKDSGGVVYKMTKDGDIGVYSGDTLLWSISGNNGVVSISNLHAESVLSQYINAESVNISDTLETVNASVSDTLSSKKVNVSDKVKSKDIEATNLLKSNNIESQHEKTSVMDVTGTGSGRDAALNIGSGFIAGLRGRLNFVTTDYTITDTDYIIISSGGSKLILPNFDQKYDGAAIIVVNSNLSGDRVVRGKITVIEDGIVHNYNDSFPLSMGPWSWMLLVYSYSLGYWIGKSI